MMNKLLIYEYINRLRREDIVKFCNIKGLNVSDNEIDIVYNYIKNDYKRFFNNPMEVINEVKLKVSNNTFNEIMKLYDKYKTKII
jgi:hypothetical protein